MDSILEKCAGDFEYNGLSHSGNAMSVMVVDDAIFVRNAISKILMSVGYDVIGEAKNGEEAVEKFLELKPDLVTMDITMPVMNGIEAVEKIIMEDSAARIVMISAMGYQNVVQRAILKGAKNFVVKPVNPDNVLEFLKVIKSVGIDGK
jgi:two-component system, chemotaxis family, chemotaxis protein CheY